MSSPKNIAIGSKNGQWKGNGVGYKALHIWVNKWKGKPLACVQCGKTQKDGATIWWANLSGKYKRDLNDFIALCCRCHRKKDFTDQWRKNISKAITGKGNPFYGKTHNKKTRSALSRFAKKRKWKRNNRGQFVSVL